MITIEQQPELFSLSRQDLVVVATSTETGQVGFKYRVHVLFASGTGEFEFFVTPNTGEACVINLKDLVSSLRLDEYGGIVHNQPSGLIYEDDSSFILFDEIGISEWWEVDGVLTENVGSEVGILEPIRVRQGYYAPEYGFQPDPESTDTNISFALNGITKRAMSDRKHDTHVWPLAASFSLGTSASVIHIPVFEEDFGVLTFSGNSTILPSGTVAKVKIQLIDSSGAPHSYTENIGGNNAEHIYCYPANLNANTTTVGLPQPADYPNWRFYTVQFLTSANAICGVTYAFYNAELYGQHDCKHDRIRLGWANSRGGWDYQNFIKKNEESFNIDRKRYHKIRGNYADAAATSMGGGFTYGGYEAGLTERGSIIQQFLSITSDWISEGEFEFLQSLMFSNQVHWIQDDGSFIPVVIEASDYVSRRERNGKLKNLDLKLRIANNVY